jgi:hypothetical protein
VLAIARLSFGENNFDVADQDCAVTELGIEQQYLVHAYGPVTDVN